MSNWSDACRQLLRGPMKDQIDPNLIEVDGGSPDVRSWPITVNITGVELTPSEVRFTSTPLTWPHVTPPGWDGGVQSTLWIVVKGPDGRWRSTGSIEFYQGRTGTGSPLSSGLADWWYYAPEIGQPQPGETVGLFIAAGDQRRKDVRSVEERSNIVTYTVPANDTGTFTFTADAPPVVIVPPPVVEPPQTDPPAPTNTFQAIAVGLAKLDAIQASVNANEAKADAFRAETRAFVRKVGAQFLAQRGQ